jgi:uroporphyrinogen decarboxylase
VNPDAGWNSRKRVLAALENKEPDRVPISFGGFVSTCILECPPDGNALSKLYKYLDIKGYEKPTPGAWGNIVVNIDERVMNRFGNDFRIILPNGDDVKTEPDGTKTILGLSCGLKIKKVGYYDDVFDFPLRNYTSVKDLDKYQNWPTSDDFKNLAKGKVDEVKKLRETTNYAIVEDGFKAFPIAMYALLSGYDKWLIDMKLNPDYYFALSDKLFEIGLKMVEYWLGPVGKYIDIATTYDDLGAQNGPILSHDDYVKFIKPYEKRMIESIKKHTNAKIYRHCCGSIYEFIPDFIEIGVDILNPVQPLAKNMEPWRLKREFGKDITFLGGIDTQELLYKSVGTVKRGVRDTIRAYAPGGGYILGTAHNIEPDTPVENIVALFEAAQEYGWYPLDQ